MKTHTGLITILNSVYAINIPLTTTEISNIQSVSKTINNNYALRFIINDKTYDLSSQQINYLHLFKLYIKLLIHIDTQYIIPGYLPPLKLERQIHV